MLTYEKLKTKSREFLSATGVTQEEFEVGAERLNVKTRERVDDNATQLVTFAER